MDRTPPTRSPMINLNPTIFDNTVPTPPTRSASPAMPIVMARGHFPVEANRVNPGKRNKLRIVANSPGATLETKLCNKVLNNEPITDDYGNIYEPNDYNKFVRIHLAIQDSLIKDNPTCFNKLKFNVEHVISALRFQGGFNLNYLQDGEIIDYESVRDEKKIKNLEKWFKKNRIDPSKRKIVMNGIKGAFNDDYTNELNYNKYRIALFVDLANIILRYDNPETLSGPRSSSNSRRKTKSKKGCAIMGGKKHTNRKKHKSRIRKTRKQKRK